MKNSFQTMMKKNDILPKIEIHEDFKEYEITTSEDKNYSHEAGYDALMTGYIFFKSLNELSSTFFLCFQFIRFTLTLPGKSIHREDEIFLE